MVIFSELHEKLTLLNDFKCSQEHRKWFLGNVFLFPNRDQIRQRFKEIKNRQAKCLWGWPEAAGRGTRGVVDPLQKARRGE